MADCREARNSPLRAVARTGGHGGGTRLRQAQDGSARHQRQLPRDVRLLPVRHLRPADCAHVLSERRPLRLADADLPELRRRLRHAPDRRPGARVPTSTGSGGAKASSSRCRSWPAAPILIAFVPSYATIGVLAPLLVVLGRLLQGFSAGVELGGVSVYLSEMATPGHKGFYVSWQSASQQVAVVVRRAARLLDRQPDVASGRLRLGLADSVLHRLRDRALPLLDPRARSRRRRSSPRERSIRPSPRSTRRWPPTGRWCSAAWRWSS